MRILGIDPGPTQSAYLRLTDGKPDSFGIVPNDNLENILIAEAEMYGDRGLNVRLAIEWVSFYGKEIHAGSETFHTCRWVGRFEGAWGDDATCELIERRAVRTALCGTMKAGDPEVRAVLIDRYGGKEKAIGKKKTPGPLYGIASHVWAALAVATVYADQHAPPHLPHANRPVGETIGSDGLRRSIQNDSEIPF